MFFLKKVLSIIVVMSFLSACTAIREGIDPNYDEGSNKKAVKITQTSKGAMITSDERILFDSGKYNIKESGQIFLERIAKILKEKTAADVLIKGHTDNVGDMNMNQRLSERRAKSVKKGLIGYGVKKSRIETEGLGYSMPVADNGTKEGRQENRRTEIIVLGETVEKIGGNSLADELSAGIDRFLENASQIMDNVFGNDDTK